MPSQAPIPSIAAERFDPSRGPVRAHDLILRIGADTAEGMAWELRHLADELERKGLSRWSCSGSPSVGHMFSYRHDPAQTHDDYFRQVDDWLAETAAKEKAHAR